MLVSDSQTPVARATTFGRNGSGVSTVCSLVTFSSSFCSHGFRVCANISRVSTRAGTLSFSSFLAVPLFESRDSVSADWCLLPARYTMLNWNCEKRSCHRVSFPDASSVVMSHLMASWSVRMVNRLPSRYKPSNRMAHTTVRH